MVSLEKARFKTACHQEFLFNASRVSNVRKFIICTYKLSKPNLNKYAVTYVLNYYKNTVLSHSKRNYFTFSIINGKHRSFTLTLIHQFCNFLSAKLNLVQWRPKQ